MADTKRHTPKDEPNEICPLCGASEAGLYLHADGRDYAHCPVCRLIFVPPEYWPAPDKKKRDTSSTKTQAPMRATSPFSSS